MPKALDLLKRSEARLKSIQAVDELLRGGLEGGRCLEIAGPPGVGKTYLALAFVQEALKEGTVVYLDTKGLPIDLFQDFDKALFTLFRLTTPSQFMSWIFLLKTGQIARPDLVVIDTVSYLTRAGGSRTFHLRQRLLDLLKSTVASTTAQGTRWIAVNQMQSLFEEDTTMTPHRAHSLLWSMPGTKRLMLFYNSPLQASHEYRWIAMGGHPEWKAFSIER